MCLCRITSRPIYFRSIHSDCASYFFIGNRDAGRRFHQEQPWRINLKAEKYQAVTDKRLEEIDWTADTQLNVYGLMKLDQMSSASWAGNMSTISELTCFGSGKRNLLNATRLLFTLLIGRFGNSKKRKKVYPISISSPQSFFFLCSLSMLTRKTATVTGLTPMAQFPSTRHLSWCCSFFFYYKYFQEWETGVAATRGAFTSFGYSRDEVDQVLLDYRDPNGRVLLTRTQMFRRQAAI